MQQSKRAPRLSDLEKRLQEYFQNEDYFNPIVVVTLEVRYMVYRMMESGIKPEDIRTGLHAANRIISREITRELWHKRRAFMRSAESADMEPTSTDSTDPNGGVSAGTE